MVCDGQRAHFWFDRPALSQWWSRWVHSAGLDLPGLHLYQSPQLAGFVAIVIGGLTGHFFETFTTVVQNPGRVTDGGDDCCHFAGQPVVVTKPFSYQYPDTEDTGFIQYDFYRRHVRDRNDV